jgi:Zn-dependent M28 family amino/carboxypeptidase
VQFIEKKLSEYGIPYFRDEWEEDSPAGRILFRNVVAQIGSTQERPFLILGAHYDTKKLDFCPGFQGSNDGASGVAILLESAKALWGKREKFRKNIEIVFFDGEECICAYSENDGLHGSKYHSRKSVAKNKKCEAVIIVDMLADKNLDAIIPVESDEKLASLFIETASEIGFSAHFTRVNTSMIDDHRPFIDAGMASLLLIDFNYGPNNVYWHSSGDNLSNTSRESLAITGKSIYLFILRLAIK